MIFHPKYFTLLMAFVINFSLVAKEQPFGCLIHEAYGPDTYTLTDGAVAQSFEPCSTGELVYVHLFMNSTDNTTFSAQMSISEVVAGQKIVLAKQQIIVPEQTKDPFVSIPLASSVNLVEGQEYWINVEANDQHPLNISYSSQDDYEGGSAFRNGIKTRGDLAFELGIRFPEVVPVNKQFFKIKADPLKCTEKVSNGNTVFDAEFEDWNLHWTPCEQTSLNSIALQMISAPSTQGLLAVYRVSSLEKYIPVYDQEITFQNTEENWQVILFDETLELEQGSKYYFEFQAFETWKTQYIGDSKRHRERKYNYWINPVKFTSWDNSKSRNYNCSSATEKVVAIHSSSNEMIVQEFTSCADGYLKSIHVGGELQKNEVLDWFIRDQNELIIDEGQVTFEDCENGIISISTNLPVLSHFKYDLVLVSNPETVNTIYLAETSNSIPVAHSDLSDLKHSLLAQFRFQELEIELADEPEELKATMSVYPNPFTDSFRVNIDGIDEECTLTLYDFSGNEVWSTRVETSEDIKVLAQLDSNLSKGYYTLRMDFKSQVFLETLVKN